MQKILAIDDKRDNLVTLSALLKNLMPDCAVITAQCGTEGMQKARAELPDAILLDVRMPDMDGFETCRRLRADESTKSIPVIMITALQTDFESRIKGLEVGANTFLTKPIDEAELVSQVKVALRIKKAEDALRMERDSLERTVQERTADLRRSEEKYRLLAENASDTIWLMRLDGTFIYHSPAVKKLRGYTPEEANRIPLDRTLTPASLIFLRSIFEEESGKPMAKRWAERILELEMYRKDGGAIWTEVSFRAVRDSEGNAISLQGSTRDITERKQADEERELTVRLLRLLHERSNIQDLMRAVTALLHNWIGCEAIGIRLRSGDDYPYFETSGFPVNFVEKENQLCTYDLEGQILRDRKGSPLLDCMCGNVLRSRFDPAKPFFTSRGSFWTNCTTALLATTTEADRQARTRNRCNGEGYESVALIPLRAADQVFGLLQINDRRPDRFTPGKIAMFERLADSLAIALSQRKAEEDLRESEELYRSLFENMLNGFAYCRMLFDQGKPQDFIYLAVNSAFESLTGLKNVVGKRVSEVIPGIRETDAELFDIYGRVAMTGKPERFEIYLVSLKMWFWISVYSPVKEHFTVVFDVITDRKEAEIKLQDSLERLRNSVGATIQVMAYAVETRDPYTAGHQNRSANLARAIATEIGLPRDKIDAIRIAGSIHDIGKLSIPAEILSKPSKLSGIEFELIKDHVRQGYEILKNVESPWPLAEIVRQHHERMDGSGYPRHLKGDEILMEARILAVADVVESMASHRPYRPTLGIDAALDEIEKNRGILYDSLVSDACLRLFRERGMQFQP